MNGKIQSMSLGQFIKGLAALLEKRDVALPLKNEKAWHLLFYDLKKSPAAAGKPKFFDNLTFDWDAPYPKCQELSDFLHGLHRTASGQADNPVFGRIRVLPQLAEQWRADVQKVDAPYREFLNSAVDKAATEFGAQSAD